MKKIEFTKLIGGLDTEKLRVRIWTKAGKVVDLVVQYESLISGSWHIIVRYDCSHGFFHRDIYFSNGSKEKQSISISSLRDGVNYAEQDIKDRFEFYRERYLKK